MHEETFSLCGSLEAQGSRTKLQDYNSSYWSKNSSKINEAKRRKRQVKKDQELNGNVSPMFESAARPGKSEQQNVEKGLTSQSDSQSLPNSGLQENRVYDYQAQFEILKQLSEIRRELSRQNTEIQNMAKPAAPVLPKVNQLEQQTVAGDIAAPNAEKLPKKKTILKRFMEKLPILGASLFLLAFLGLNTYFLVSEQVSLYTSMSYSAGMAMMIAVMSEASLILLSSMASWTSSFEWKAWLTVAMFVFVAVMVGVLDSSAKNRSSTAARQTQEAKNIEKQIQTLRALEAPILARIESLDPKAYPTKISELSAQLTASPNGYSYKIEQLSAKLATISTAEADTSMLAWQRRAALFLNLLVSGFLGYLWSSKENESLLMILSRSIRSYLQKTCEA